jgi:hypothetical protein
MTAVFIGWLIAMMPQIGWVERDNKVLSIRAKH